MPSGSSFSPAHFESLPSIKTRLTPSTYRVVVGGASAARDVGFAVEATGSVMGNSTKLRAKSGGGIRIPVRGIGLIGREESIASLRLGSVEGDAARTRSLPSGESRETA